ncbi:MAG: hypothetical protein R2744_14030 [Bacteroidales bacterium]
MLLIPGVGFLKAQNGITQSSNDISVTFARSGISSITSLNDQFGANPVAGIIGQPEIRYSIGEGDWLTHYMGESEILNTDSSVTYKNFIKGMPMSLEQQFSLDSGVLDWKIKLQTEMEYPVRRILPFPFHGDFHGVES